MPEMMRLKAVLRNVLFVIVLLRHDPFDETKNLQGTGAWGKAPDTNTACTGATHCALIKKPVHSQVRYVLLRQR